MGMTRQEIRARAQDLLGEAVGSQGAPSVLAYDGLINMATDEVARTTDCYAGSVGSEIVAGQSLYGLPQLYKIKGAFVTDSSFNKIKLQETTPWELDDQFGGYGGSAGWRNMPTGTPLYFVTRGDNVLVLYPTPDTSSFVYAYSDLVVQSNVYQIGSAARPFVATDVQYTLRITGGTGFNTGIYTILAVSGGIATVDQPVGAAGATVGVATLSLGGLLVEGSLVPGTGTWDAQTSLCPLPDRAHMAVVWRTAILRAISLPSPENQLRMPFLQGEFRKQLGYVEKETALLTQATAHGDFHRFPFGGGFY